MGFEDMFGDGIPPTEPNAEIRDAAKGLYSMKVAFIEAGFTTEETMHLIATLFKSQLGA